MSRLQTQTKKSVPQGAILVAALITLGASLPFQACKRAAPPEPSSSAAPHPVSLRWTLDQTGSNKLLVEVQGLGAASLDRLRESTWTPAEWQRLLSVYAGRPGSTSDPSLPPMLGTYRVESNVLLFESHFPVEPEAEYRALFRPAALTGEAGEPVTSVYQSPSRNSSPTTIVSHVYPSADVLPENLLKFYVHFSAPMSRGRIYDHIHLRDSAGKEVELPFLEIDEELWDPAMTRLTLIIDPGRIKRGVRPLEEIGPVLEAGKSYTLAINSASKDGVGVPLKQSFEKTFKAGPSDREPVDPALWKTQPPPSGTLEPLSVIFPEPMDNAVTPRSIRVTSASGDSIDGKAGLEDQERRWTFVPDNPWRRGGYKFVIQTTIEDLAGNNIGKAFDVDKIEPMRKRHGSSTVTLAFEVR
ncbi:MAG: Ig-like domain-containing protein [Acidobacteriota bacterium]